jgi:hypothetical protein
MISGASAYELQRQQRIERNKELLHQFGIHDLGLQRVRSVTLAKRPCKAACEASPSHVLEDNPEANAESAETRNTSFTLRRSTRLRERELVACTNQEQPLNSRIVARLHGVRSKRLRTSVSDLREMASVSLSASNSTKYLNCDVDKLSTYLGGFVPVPPRLGGQVKRSVIEAACAAAVRPVFNRMSGICEWWNAVMLFVNLPAGDRALQNDKPSILNASLDRGYVNVFYGSGEYIVWYAQRTQDPEHPTLRRLIVDSERRGASETNILLFCRMPKPYDSHYLYCGRLRYVEHSNKTHPIRFNFQLMDFASLIEPKSSCGTPASAYSTAIRGDYAAAWELASRR